MSTTTLTMSEAIREALREALDRPEPMMIVGQDIGPYGGAFGVTGDLYHRFGGVAGKYQASAQGSLDQNKHERGNGEL